MLGSPTWTVLHFTQSGKYRPIGKTNDQAVQEINWAVFT